MRKVNAEYWDGTKRCFVNGWFHQWSITYEPAGLGPGHRAIALVEGIESGQIRECIADTVVFIDMPNGGQYESA